MLNTIRPYITRDEPFGPIDSVDIDPSDIQALKLLFEQHNWIYKNLRNRPSIIIGRRGAGKTYYLRSVFFDHQYDFYVEIRTARVLGYIARVIQKMTKEVVFPEMVSELWETILWIAVFSELRKHSVIAAEDLNDQLQAEKERVIIRLATSGEERPTAPVNPIAGAAPGQI